MNQSRFVLAVLLAALVSGTVSAADNYPQRPVRLVIPYPPGGAGDAGDSLYLLLEGAVEVRLPSESKEKGRRLDVFEAGMSFGEMGLLDRAPRSADVVVLEPVKFRVLDRTLSDRIGQERPDMKIRMLEQLASQLSANLRKANAETAAYKG